MNRYAGMEMNNRNLLFQNREVEIYGWAQLIFYEPSIARYFAFINRPYYNNFVTNVRFNVVYLEKISSIRYHVYLT